MNSKETGKLSFQNTGSSVTLAVRVALAQVDARVGDFSYNAGLVEKYIELAREAGADIVLFPELVLPGYPPEDLLLKNDFLRKNRQALMRVVKKTRGITAVVGFAEKDGKKLYNAAAVASHGKLLGTCRKAALPNYGVFDEKRYFDAGSTPVCLRISGKSSNQTDGASHVASNFALRGGVNFGLTVCEDLWDADGPGKTLCGAGGARVLLNISSSPFHSGKGKERIDLLRARARQYNAYVAYANLVGGQDELVFDGHSLVVSPAGEVLAQGNSFEEEIIFVDLEIPPALQTRHKKIATLTTPSVERESYPDLPTRQKFRKKSGIEEIHDALVLGTRDYIVKSGFQKVAVGLSGGIDSAVTAAIAAEAVGPENVTGALMPSPYSSKGSVDDSLELARRLGIHTLTLPIDRGMKAYGAILKDTFKNLPPGIAEENIQARIRGNLLMALSNKMGWLVLTTGNKSEIAVGYCTLYGDMAGGFAVIKDLPKTRVYELARFMNRRAKKDGGPIPIPIPKAIIDKEPSAELRPDQKDSDSLPPYEILDRILLHYIEKDWDLARLKKLGYPEEVLKRVVRLVDQNEYKRRQSPPGVKLTPKAFGKDRRLPIVNRFAPWDEE